MRNLEQDLELEEFRDKYDNLRACVINMCNAGLWTTNVLASDTEKTLWRDLLDKADLRRYYFNDGTDSFVWMQKEKIPDKNSKLNKEVVYAVANPYGLCPICHEPGITRERRIGGNDKCANGHEYPSSEAIAG